MKLIKGHWVKYANKLLPKWQPTVWEVETSVGTVWVSWETALILEEIKSKVVRD